MSVISSEIVKYDWYVLWNLIIQIARGMSSSSVEPTILTMISYFSFLFPNGLKQMWHLAALLYSLSCDLVSGSIGFSRKELYNLLASEIMCSQNFSTQSEPLYCVMGFGYVSVRKFGINAPSRWFMNVYSSC